MRGYKTELRLNNRQRTHCRRHAGAARFAYNWGLRRKKEAYQAKQKMPSAIALHKELNALKKSQFPWMYQVSKCATQEALRDLDNAFAHFFRTCKLKKQGQHHGKCGYLRFKSLKSGIGSFRLTGSIAITNTHVKLPRLGQLRLKERGYLPTNARVLSATVSEKAGRWFVSVQVEEPYTAHPAPQRTHRRRPRHQGPGNDQRRAHHRQSKGAANGTQQGAPRPTSAFPPTQRQ
ncbi:MAG: helix-turn-helix domain-containing protein [Chloroflexaceae bacterium]|nr:helix-turn-helix domain-containing protein [Chloroflexaceae bacterium]